MTEQFDGGSPGIEAGPPSPDGSVVVLADGSVVVVLADGGTAPPTLAHDASLDASQDAAAPVQPVTDAGGTAQPEAGIMTAGEPPGRLNGMVAAHNRVRAAVDTTPPLAALAWDPVIAAFAQEWADSLATTCNIMHRSNAMLQPHDYGENIATFGISGGNAPPSDAQKAVDGWASEKMCWTYGTLSGFGMAGTEKCDATCTGKLSSDGCGHYTAIVSRRSTAFGCGVASCKKSGSTFDIWVCNYSPAGNFVGRAPY